MWHDKEVSFGTFPSQLRAEKRKAMNKQNDGFRLRSKLIN